MPHARRPAHSRHHPLHVTVRVREGLPSLREQSLFLGIREQIRAGKRRFLRIVHFSVQSNHLHLLIEAPDRARLSSGMKGLGVRVARRLNRLLGARGNVLADRYHARALSSPRQVRNALVYVLFNDKKHGRRGPVDACSSARFHDGWADERARKTGAEQRFKDDGTRGSPVDARGDPDQWPVVPGETWLVTRGWKRHGLLRRDECPARR